MHRRIAAAAVKPLLLAGAVYAFLLSIKLLGYSFRLFGSGFAEAMIQMTGDPFVGLLTGIVATSVIQSSSTTTSIVVGLVAGNALSLTNAIPIVMGANIGTTITNVLVSLGHVTNRVEFRRAFSASIVHDFFNLCTVAVLFPMEMKWGLIARTATALESGFAGVGGLKVFNPVKAITDPVVDWAGGLVAPVPHASVLLMLASVVLLFGALAVLIRTIRSLVVSRIEVVIQNYLFRNDLFGLTLGLLMTAVVQSSSITTSLIVPLAGAGLVTVRQIFPYMLGANLGTTVTAILAALATQNDIAVTVAFSHLCFNAFGILLFYPLRFIPIGLAEFVGDRVTRSRRNMAIFVTVYFLQYVVPGLFIWLR